MQDEQLEAFVAAFLDPCVVVSASLDLYAANGPARAALGSGPVDRGAFTRALAGDRDAWRAYVRLCARSPEPLPGGLRLHTEGGGEASYRCYGSRIGQRDAERPALVLLRFVARDATDPFLALNQTIAQLTDEVSRRRAAEDELRRFTHELRDARDRAEETSRAKDEFLATLSHELRTPLNAILGWARILQTGAAPSSEKHAQAVDTIVRNALAQSHLIEDLLDISRIITGKLRMEVADVDVNDVVRAAADAVRPAAEAKQIRLQLLFNPDTGLVRGDAERLQQVFWNLLANAVKFTRKGGRIHLSIRRRDSVVEVEIADTGIGIDPAYLPHVFGRFSQAAPATATRTSGGLGLGLAIVKHLVEAHGGTVDAHSEGVGRGSSFIVRIPIVPVRHSTPVPPETAPSEERELVCPPELDGLHVLVLEDEPDARELVKMVLEQCRAVVRTAANVAEALAAIASEPKPAVIVSDIGLPDEDGYSFMRRLRALPREQGGHIPAVALTAFARAEDRRKALVAGFQSHAAKPIEPQELVMVVANLAGRFG